MSVPRAVRICSPLAAVLLAGIWTTDAQASACQRAWDLHKVMSGAATALPGQAIRLIEPGVPDSDADPADTDVTPAQLAVFQLARHRLAPVAGVNPALLICATRQVNAHAVASPQGVVPAMTVGLTVGLIRLVDGDRDLAAALMSHEMAHHALGHVGGVRAPAPLSPFFAQLFAQLGGLDRDHERQADEVGVRYMQQAGFDPAGALRLALRMRGLENGHGGPSGLPLFNTHPGWDERIARLQRKVAGAATPPATQP